MNERIPQKVEYNQNLSCFSSGQIEAIAKFLGDSSNGLTGSEINHLLNQIRVANVSPEASKWQRLYNALAMHQNLNGVGNHVVQLINHAMEPAKHIGDPDRFRDWQAVLNQTLSLSGMRVGDDGRVCKAKKAETLDDAVSRANRLKSQLQQRKVHAEIFKYCTPEIVSQNYFHAVFEAVKSISSRIRSLAGLTEDGAELVQKAFSFQKPNLPLLAINPLDTESFSSEQRGFVNLLTGLFGYVRNPLAHNAKVDWALSELDALDMLTTVSMVHRKLDTVWKPSKTTSP